MGADMKRGREGKRNLGTEEGAEGGREGALVCTVMYVQAVPHKSASALTRARAHSLLPSLSLLPSPLSHSHAPLPLLPLPPLPHR
jgi:hypothetical protein